MKMHDFRTSLCVYSVQWVQMQMDITNKFAALIILKHVGWDLATQWRRGLIQNWQTANKATRAQIQLR